MTFIYVPTAKMIKKQEQDHADETDKKDVKLPLLDFATIIAATNNFWDENKLGQGGFGPVYMVLYIYVIW